MILPIFKTASQEQFEDAKYGMFIHWGLYSLLERGEWVKFVENIPNAEYEKLRTQFDPINYDADRWVQLMQDAGIRYVVITARHHDGFSMFATQQSPEWSISNTPYAKDVMKPLVEACRKRGIMFFFYYSLLDWRFPGYWERGKNVESSEAMARQYRDQVKELLSNYGKIDVLWYDGGWVVNEMDQYGLKDWKELHKYWGSKKVNAMAASCSPASSSTTAPASTKTSTRPSKW